MVEEGAKNGGCMITYPADGHQRNALKCAIKLGINEIILMMEDRHYMSLFDSVGLNTIVKPISIDNVNLVITSVVDLILDVKSNHNDLSILLLPCDPMIVVGTYIAACIEKVKVHTSTSNHETEYFLMPLFPFVDLNKNERFILTKIMEKKEVNTKNLFKIIKKAGKCDILGPKLSRTPKESSMLKCLRRILNKLEKRGLLSKEKKDRCFVWKSTIFSKFMFGQGTKGT